MVELEIRKTFQFLNKKFSLECRITSNPLERAYWSKDGVVLGLNSHQLQHHTAQSTYPHHAKVDKYDVSTLSEPFKTLLTLTVMVFDLSCLFLVTFFLFDIRITFLTEKERQQARLWGISMLCRKYVWSSLFKYNCSG
jgi:hypothetical protein